MENLSSNNTKEIEIINKLIEEEDCDQARINFIQMNEKEIKKEIIKKEAAERMIKTLREVSMESTEIELFDRSFISKMSAKIFDCLSDDDKLRVAINTLKHWNSK